MTAHLGETAPRNRILASLPHDALAQFADQLERVSFEIRDVLFDYDRTIEHVYFVESGVMSIVGVMADGSAVETATVGNEGMIGIPIFLGADRTAAQAFCQVRGDALRLSASAFRAQIARGGPLVAALNRYTQALLTQIGQSSACNRMHSIEKRCARWLLQTHDRVGAAEGIDTFDLTHQFLSQMLGVRRASVTFAASALRDDGLIEYAQGVVTILDRAGLERAACECYAVIRREFERLLEGRETPDPLGRPRTSENGQTTVGDGSPLSGANSRDDQDAERNSVDD